VANDLEGKGQFGVVADLVSGPGRESPTVLKLIFVLRRCAKLGAREFQEYWRVTHAPLVQRHAEALGIRRYVQSHTVLPDANDVLREGRGASPAYDGVAEIWVRDEDLSMQVTAAAQTAAEILLADERRFIDLSASALWWSREIVMINELQEIGT